MPIITKKGLPVNELLKKESIQVMEETEKTEGRIIEIAILNLMPMKQDTELQLLRELSHTQNQIKITFVKVVSHQSKTTSQEYLEQFYSNFEEIQDKNYDGFIITGAPIEHLEFEEVTYWEELKKIMEWTKTHVKSTLHICWGAQAGLYYHYGIEKYLLPDKMFGVFAHEIKDEKSPIVTSLRNNFKAPHSRHTGVNLEQIKKNEKLNITALSKEAGVFLVEDKKRTQIFDTGHFEYDSDTLDKEYKRDLQKGVKIEQPSYYYQNGVPQNTWKQDADIFYSNWIHYYLV